MTARAAGLRALFAACAVLAAIGAAILDDYGVSADEDAERRIAEINWRYILDEGALDFDTVFVKVHVPNRYYGVAFALPVLLAEKALGLDDDRHVHLLRHAAIHILFLAGALCCALLARRMTGSALAALLALALFVLQPRIYAHAFFNSKDVPALALFAVCLWLAHRAFRRGGAGAFLLCGAGVAVLTNLRIPAGLVLLAAVGGLLVLDSVLASDPAARRRALATLAAFAAGWAGVLYAMSPWMWADGPAAFVDAVTALARHSNPVGVLFQGRIFPASGLPPHFFPVWFAVSTPPVLLALGLAGFAAALRRGLARPGAALRNTPARFALLLAACWAGPPLAAALAGAHAYSDWRHMFFIHAPFCVLAALGAAALARAARRIGDSRYGESRRSAAAGGPGKGGYGPRSVHNENCRRRMARRRGAAAAAALASAGVAAAATSAILLHPHQQVYFNGLEDRSTPWRIRERYDFGYWGAAFRAGLERALAERPSAEIRVCGSAGRRHLKRNMRILRSGDRARLSVVGFYDACDAAISHPRRLTHEGRPWDRPIVPPAWSLAAWGSSFLDLFDMDAARAARRRMDDPVPARPPDIAARFDVRVQDGAVIYARDGCAPKDMAPRFFLHIEPADPADLPEDRRRHGFDNRDFAPRARMPAFPRPPRRAAWERIDDRCLVWAPLPDYSVRRVRTGQIVGDGAGGWRRLWEGEIDIAGEDGR